MKTCSKCTISKSYDNFHLGKNYKDGYKSWCISCERQWSKDNSNPERRKVWEKNNQDKVKQHRKKVRQNNNLKNISSEKIIFNKLCSKCNKTKICTDFYICNQNSDGYSYKCKECEKSRLKNHYIHNKKNRQISARNCHLKRKQRLVKWANLQKIAEIYKNRPEGYHVDHIIPLNGKDVCGLHVENNLQYLPKVDNLKKGNK